MNNRVGRTTRIDIPELGIVSQQAKVDTGAWSSSLHVEDIRVEAVDGVSTLYFRPIDSSFSMISMTDYEVKTVKSSFGDVEERYCIYLSVTRRGQTQRTLFNLTNRSTQRHQILLGRLFLKKFKLLVDVTMKAREQGKQT